jgi:Alternative complex III, ActD subunit
MSRMLLAEFADGRSLLDAARDLKQKGISVIDAFTPIPVDELAELLGVASTRIRVIMFIGGIAVATLLYATEWYSAVINYPVNSGGRPLNSWIPFLLPPFATGIFAAALVGLITLFVATGLRLHHPLFALDGFEYVTQDRFVLLLARPEGDADGDTRALLTNRGALRFWEVGG